MNIEIAKRLINEKFPNDKIIKIIEYKNFYTFSLIPKGAKKDTTYFNKTLAVDKKTSKLSVFNPLLMNMNKNDKGIERH